MAHNFDYPSLGAPDLKLRTIMMKAQAGARLSNRDFKRLAQRQWVENGGNISADLAQERMGNMEKTAQSNPYLHARTALAESEERARMIGRFGSEENANKHISNTLETQRLGLASDRQNYDWNRERAIRYQAERDLLKERLQLEKNQDARSDKVVEHQINASDRNYNLAQKRLNNDEDQRQIENSWKENEIYQRNEDIKARRELLKKELEIKTDNATALGEINLAKAKFIQNGDMDAILEVAQKHKFDISDFVFKYENLMNRENSNTDSTEAKVNKARGNDTPTPRASFFGVKPTPPTPQKNLIKNTTNLVTF